MGWESGDYGDGMSGGFWEKWWQKKMFLASPETGEVPLFFALEAGKTTILWGIGKWKTETSTYPILGKFTLLGT